MTTPQRSVRLTAFAQTTLNRFVYEPGEIFWDTTNQTLRVYNGSVLGGSILATRSWVLANGGGGGGSAGNIDSLTDVQITSPSPGQVLKYDGTKWYNGIDDIGGSGSPPSNSFSTIAVNSQSSVIATTPTDTLTLVAGTNVTITTNSATDTITISAADQGTPSQANGFGTVRIAGEADAIADTPEDILTLVAGTGISLSTNAGSDTITITATGGGGMSSNAFSTIAVSGQSDVIADSSADILTLVAGSNITITTDPISDTITIASTGGGGGGSSYDQSLNTTDDVEFNTVTATQLISTGTGTPTYTSGSDFIFNTGSSAGSVVVNGAVEATKFLTLTPLSAAPSGAVVGTFAVANRTGWDPASKGSGNPYPVFYNGAVWTALY